MSEPYHEPVYYLYENALSQIVSLVDTLCKDGVERPAHAGHVIPRLREIAMDGLRHDFKAIYPDHTDEFHARLKREIVTGPSAVASTTGSSSVNKAPGSAML